MYLPESSAAALVIDLERRARRVEAVGGAVQQRRGRAAGGADVVDPPEVALDQVRVVGRPRGHHQQLPVARVERDHRAALARELLHRHALRARLDRQPDVVALDRRAADLVERRLEDGAEVRVRAGQVVVQRRLEPRARARLGRVADEVREQAALRVAAQVELLAGDLLDPVRGEDRPVGGPDQAALDRELGHALDLVVLPVGEARAGPGLPVGRADDQRRHEPDGDECEPCDLPVHPRSAFARLETSRRPASRTKFATTLEPP